MRTQGGARIRDGAFFVVAENPDSEQRFDWEVKAVRADGPELNVEPEKDQISVLGFGPYTYQAKPRADARPCATSGVKGDATSTSTQ